MASGILDIVKETALEAVNSSAPMVFTFGTVIKEKPLEIKLENSLILKQADNQLILSRAVTDYKIPVKLLTVSGDTVIHDGKWETEYTETKDWKLYPDLQTTYEHKHDIKGTKNTTNLMVYGSLKVGDKAILFRVQGGNSYVVLDKVGKLE